MAIKSFLRVPAAHRSRQERRREARLTSAMAPDSNTRRDLCDPWGRLRAICVTCGCIRVYWRWNSGDPIASATT
jgi:hypothetical protein